MFMARRKRPAGRLATSVVVVLLVVVMLSLVRIQKSVETRSSHHPKKKIGPTIVILPGPHKTGSTSIQAALYQWIHSNHTKGWAYPIPTLDELDAIGSSSSIVTGGEEEGGAGGKGFSLMVTRLFANPEWSDQELIRHSRLLQLYQRKIRAAWDAGQNIVIASEHLDRLVLHHVPDTSKTPMRPTGLTPEALWKRFLALLPSSSNLVVGLTHRTPRIEHLLSVWHHVGHESLADFITKPRPPGLASTQHSLNSLGLAKFFLRQGYTVRILNSGGVKDAGMDLPSAVACHVLRIPEFCAPAPQFTTRYNARPEPAARNLGNHTLKAIDNLLSQHDCQYQQLQAEWYYGHKTFAKCRSIPRPNWRKVPRPFSDTIQSIIRMVCRRNPTRYC